MYIKDYERYGMIMKKVFKDNIILFGKRKANDVLIRFENKNEQKMIIKVFNKMNINTGFKDSDVSGYFTLNLDKGNDSTLYRNFDVGSSFIEEYNYDERMRKSLNVKQFIRKMAIVKQMKREEDK